MDITPVITKGFKQITSYGGGGFSVNEETLTGSLILLPKAVIPWNVTSFDALKPADFSLFFSSVAIGMELVLLGCGPTHQPLPEEIASLFHHHKIAIEIMTTGAACRTYNVLLGEGRLIGAALIAV